MSWRDLHDAPRDRAVWLFLPASKWTAAADGRVSDVQHDCVIAQWEGGASAWVERGTRRHVYPSMWSDADVNGAAPDMPTLA